MKAVVRYQASDGTVFDDPGKCTEYESQAEYVNSIMRMLPSVKIETCSYYQHEESVALYVRQRMNEMAKRLYPSLLENVDPETAHPSSFIGRVVCDNEGPLAKAWRRLMCIDWNTFREYSQPYYAAHPHEATTRFQ